MPLFVNVKVVPSSGRQECRADKSGIIKCYVKSAPEGGKANAELIKFLSKKLGVAQREIAIVGGATSRKKRLKIERDISLGQFYKMLGLERMLSCLDTPGAE